MKIIKGLSHEEFQEFMIKNNFWSSVESESITEVFRKSF
jgi:hypothetical protein